MAGEDIEEINAAYRRLRAAEELVRADREPLAPRPAMVIIDGR